MLKRYSGKDIAKWHKATFPKALLQDQLNKLAEEADECFMAIGDRQRLEELADMYIVACVLWERYHAPLGDLLMEYLKQDKSVSEFELLTAVDEKMAVNVKRKWHNNRHVA